MTPEAAQKATTRLPGAPAAVLLAVALLLAACSHETGLGGISSGPQKASSTVYLQEFRKIDTAHAGRITLDQATAYYSKLFNDLDTQHRGFLTKDDLRPIVPIMDAKSPEILMGNLDNHGDGKLTQDEFLIIANWLFQRAKNDPTVLTLEDVSPPSGGWFSGNSGGASKDGQGSGGRPRRGGGQGGGSGGPGPIDAQGS